MIKPCIRSSSHLLSRLRRSEYRNVVERFSKGTSNKLCVHSHTCMGALIMTSFVVYVATLEHMTWGGDIHVRTQHVSQARALIF